MLRIIITGPSSIKKYEVKLTESPFVLRISDVYLVVEHAEKYGLGEEGWYLETFDFASYESGDTSTPLNSILVVDGIRKEGVFYPADNVRMHASIV